MSIVNEEEIPWNEITADGTIITENINYLNFTLNLSELNFSGGET